MKKTVSRFFTALMLVGATGAANALTFALDSYSVALNDSDPGLVVYSTPILTAPISFDLAVGDVIEAELFTIGTNENSVEWFEDTVAKDISVTFDFSAPEVLGDVTGSTDGQFRLFSDDIGSVEWSGPTEFNFGTGGLFTIALSNETFGTPGSATVKATMTYISESTASVPEPGSLALLGLGLAGMGFTGRKKLAA